MEVDESVQRLLAGGERLDVEGGDGDGEDGEEGGPTKRPRNEEFDEEDEDGGQPLVAADDVATNLKVWARTLQRPPKGNLKVRGCFVEEEERRVCAEGAAAGCGRRTSTRLRPVCDFAYPLIFLLRSLPASGYVLAGSKRRLIPTSPLPIQTYSEGLWRPDKQLCRVIKTRGNDLRSMGFAYEGDTHLYPEETLFLVERCKLEVGNLTTPELYEAVDLYHYLTYAYFRQTSLIIFRADPSCPVGVAFEAHAPSSQFRKTAQNDPIFYIMFGGTRAPVPMDEEMVAIFEWANGVPVKYAMVSDEGGVFAVNLAHRPLENHTHLASIAAAAAQAGGGARGVTTPVVSTVDGGEGEREEQQQQGNGGVNGAGRRLSRKQRREEERAKHQQGQEQRQQQE